MVTCFPCWGIALSFLIILPAGIFGAIFFVFVDFCPLLEDIAGSLGSDVAKGNVSLALKCPDPPAALFEIFDIGLDFNSAIADAVASANSAFKPIELPQEFADFHTINDGYSPAGNLSSNTLLFQHRETFPAVVRADGSAKGDIDTMFGLIGAKDSILNETRDAVEAVIDFALAIPGKANEVSARANNVIEEFGVTITNDIGNFSADSLNCRVIKCVWAPFKNILCSSFLAGMAFWIISGILAILALAGLELSLFLRRRHMGKPLPIEGENSDDVLVDDPPSEKPVDDLSDSSVDDILDRPQGASGMPSRPSISSTSLHA
jgi:hypothetical protein